MQSGISPDNWQKVSGLGIYQSILNHAVVQICKIGYFSMIELRFPYRFYRCVYSLEAWKMVSDVLEE